MSFCTKCGRSRSGELLFCTTCGTKFPAGPPTAQTPLPQAAVTPRRQFGGGRRMAFIVVVALLVVLAAAGGSYALVLRPHGHTTARSGHPAVTVPASTAPASASPTASASASPSTSPLASVTASPTQTGTVQVAPGLADNPAEPQVEAYLNRYFNSINTQNYSEYDSLLDAQEQQSDSQSSFDSGFATTKDSNEVLTGIEDTGSGSVAATVSFTSRQNPADSVDNSACNDWKISLYLVLEGSSYVMTATPAGYRASYTDC